MSCNRDAMHERAGDIDIGLMSTQDASLQAPWSAGQLASWRGIIDATCMAYMA